jgi:enoyl-CoA hydratase
MTYQNIILEKNNSVVTVTINRPDKLNALNIQTMDELKTVFTEFSKDDSVAVVIVTGKGEKAFVAGADISELNKLDMISGKEFSENGQEIFNLIENSGKPVIAAVNGFALGGGCELALACNIRIASENAKFGQPEVNLGIIPGFGGSQRLTRLVNSGRAMEYILTGDMIDAQEAFRIGLVNRVYKQDELLIKATEMANKIASKAPMAIKLAVKAINAADEISLRDGQSFEAALFGSCCGTEDSKEGTTAFLNKRKAEFKGK